MCWIVQVCRDLSQGKSGRMYAVEPCIVPDTAQVIADVIGVEKTLQLVRQPQVFKKRNVYIPSPKRLGSSHWLVQALGAVTARKLAEEFSGVQLSLAQCTSAVK